MNWETVLLVDDQLRPIWRFLLSAVMVAVAYVGVAITLGLVFGILGRHPELFTALFAATLSMLPVLIGIFKLLTTVFEGKPFGSVGLAFCGRWKQELGLGLGVGTAMIALVAGAERLLGLADFAWTTQPPRQILAAGLYLGFFLLVAAVNEELVFRGYPFQRLVESIGPIGAVVISSALFAVSHLGNPFRTWTAGLNTVLVGIPLAVAYLRTRALWMSIGLHFAWNFFQGYGLGLPVSGLALPVTVVTAEVRGARWLTGGHYGPEGGILASVAIVGATLYLSFSKRIYTSEEMRALVFGTTRSKAESADGALAPSAHPDDENSNRQG